MQKPYEPLESNPLILSTMEEYKLELSYHHSKLSDYDFCMILLKHINKDEIKVYWKYEKLKPPYEVISNAILCEDYSLSIEINKENKVIYNLSFENDMLNSFLYQKHPFSIKSIPFEIFWMFNHIKYVVSLDEIPHEDRAILSIITNYSSNRPQSSPMVYFSPLLEVLNEPNHTLTLDEVDSLIVSSMNISTNYDSIKLNETAIGVRCNSVRMEEYKWVCHEWRYICDFMKDMTNAIEKNKFVIINIENGVKISFDEEYLNDYFYKL